MKKENPYLRIKNNIIDTVGNTPMVKLQRIPAEHGILCEIFAKCEFMNAGGSIKDRIAKEMTNSFKIEGSLKKNGTLIEATSGNTGIGIAMVGASQGYKSIAVMPNKNAGEKVKVLKALGSEIILTPSEVDHTSENSHFSIAKRLHEELDNSVFFDQFNNKVNVLTHYKFTAQELFDQCQGKLDLLCCGVGTGGTITGTSYRLKELDPSIKVIGIDPIGSKVALPEELNVDEQKYLVEGIGHDFLSNVLDRSVIDEWIKTDDKTSFSLARDLIRKEGLLCGSSSGAVLAGAIKYLKQRKLDKCENIRCVIVLPDSIRNYLSKFCSDEWMVKKGFMLPSDISDSTNAFYGKKLKSLKLKILPSSFGKDTTILDCLKVFEKGELAVPLMDKGEILGVVTQESLLAYIREAGNNKWDLAIKAISDSLAIVGMDTDLSVIERLLRKDGIVIGKLLDKKTETIKLFVVTTLDLISALGS